AALGARACAGYVPGAAATPLQLTWQRSEAEVERWLRLVGHLGAATASPALEFPLRDAERKAAAALRAAAGVGGRYVCLHPGARLRSRRWPVGRFAAVAAMLRRDGLPIVMTGSPAETTLTYEIVRQLRRPS